MKALSVIKFIASALILIAYTYIPFGYLKMAYEAEIRAQTYEAHFEEARNQLESLYRTIGKKADLAYTCKRIIK